MPRLPAKKAKSVAKAQSSGGTINVLPDGVYTAKLVNVETGKGPKGPLWTWQYKTTDDSVPETTLWERTSLSPEAEWKLNETFNAFGVDPDTDTDELIGQEVRLVVQQRTIPDGARRGEKTNDIKQIRPLDEEDEEIEPDEELEEEDVEDEEEPDDEEEYEDEEEPEDEDEEEEEVPPPTRRRTSAKTSSPASSRARASSPAASRSTRTPSRARAQEVEEEAPPTRTRTRRAASADSEAAPARTATGRAARTGRRASATAETPPARTRRRKAADDSDIPF